MTPGNDTCHGLHGFGVALTFVEGRAIIGLRGELDLLSAPELEAVLDAVVDRGHRRVVVDLAELGFMDLSGLRAITAASERAALAGGSLSVCSPSAMVCRLLAVTGLAGVVQVEEADAEPVVTDRLGADRSGTDRLGTDRSGRLGTDRLGTDGVRTGHVGTEQSEGAPVAIDVTDLARPMRRPRAIPADDDVVDNALRLVVVLAQAAVASADGVSVSLRRRGHLSTVAASDGTISEMDANQYDTGEGPCVDASAEGRWFHAESLAAETRWPAFTPRAHALGINAILSSPLLAQDRPVGALNIYSRTAAAFTPADQKLASVFASEASSILSDAGVDVGDDELGHRLQRALRGRQLITLAQGVLMERNGVGEYDAFTALRRFSLGNRKPMRDWAADIVASSRRSWREIPLPQEET